jgi:SAM-dependent methyltransferase
MSLPANMQEYFSGRRLYGEDLPQSEVDEWLANEEEGFADLGAKDRSSYSYGYHALNRVHAFDRLAGRRFKHALGFGSAYGHELKPLIPQIEKVCLLDASSSFLVSDIDGTPVRYIKAARSGRIDLPDASVDLITCFGVLHHIPRVGQTLQEMYRVLEPGGIALIREPIVSMGDWRVSRPGLTKHERGLPYRLFSAMLRNSGFRIVHVAPCIFPAIDHLGRFLDKPMWNSVAAVKIDALVSRLFAWNLRYHRESFLEKFGPAHAFWMVEKSSPPGIEPPL